MSQVDSPRRGQNSDRTGERSEGGTFMTDVDIEERRRSATPPRDTGNKDDKRSDAGRKSEERAAEPKRDAQKEDVQSERDNTPSDLGEIEIQNNPRHKPRVRTRQGGRVASYVEEAEAAEQEIQEKLEEADRELNRVRSLYGRTKHALAGDASEHEVLKEWKSKFNHVCANLDNALHVMALLKEELGMRDTLQDSLNEHLGENEKLATGFFEKKGTSGTAYGNDSKGVGLHGRRSTSGTPKGSKAGTPAKSIRNTPKTSNKRSTNRPISLHNESPERRRAIADLQRRLNEERDKKEVLEVNVHTFKGMYDYEVKVLEQAEDGNKQLTKMISDLRKNLIFLVAQVNELEHRRNREEIETRRLQQSFENQLSAKMREAEKKRLYAHRSELSTIRRNGVQVEGGTPLEANVDLLRSKVRDSIKLQRKLKSTRTALQHQLAALKASRLTDGLEVALREETDDSKSGRLFDGAEQTNCVWRWTTSDLTQRLRDAAHKDYVVDKNYSGPLVLRSFHSLDTPTDLVIKNMVADACVAFQMVPEVNAEGTDNSMWLWDVTACKEALARAGLSKAAAAVQQGEISGAVLVNAVATNKVATELATGKSEANDVTEFVVAAAVKYQVEMCSQR